MRTLVESLTRPQAHPWKIADGKSPTKLPWDPPLMRQYAHKVRVLAVTAACIGTCEGFTSHHPPILSPGLE